MAAITKSRFLKEFPKSLAEDAGAVFVGAGVSIGAGYPSWQELLKDIGEELGVSSADVHDLAALAQWHVRKSAGYTRIRQVVRDEIGVEHAIPESLGTIARLPVRHLWTTNYDRLIERAFAAIGRPIDVISASADLAIRPRPGAARLYKMHGSIDHLDDIVIATDDYELFRRNRGAYLPLLQAHLTSFSMLFVGLSFTDPNVRHVLSLIRESFTDAPPEHFALVRPPRQSDFRTEEEFAARLKQHSLWADDLRRYGLLAVEVDDFDEIPGLVAEIERGVARQRVWISGSWLVSDPEAARLYEVASRVGSMIGEMGLALVSGAGALVGSASIGGFLSNLQRAGAWDLDRRLIVRSFPQPFGSAAPDTAQWTLLRNELARVAGTVIFIGGAKENAGALVDAAGVAEEFDIAKKRGLFLLPVAATGGTAKTISDSLIGSDLPTTGLGKQRPSDAELADLADCAKSPSELADAVIRILKTFVES